MAIEQIIIKLGNDKKQREVEITMIDPTTKINCGASGWTLSEALKNFKEQFPAVKDEYDLLNMLKY